MLKFTRNMAVAIVMLFALFSATETIAQPTNYCVTCPNPQYNYNYCYTWAYVYITQVTLIEEDGGAVSLSRASGFDGNYYFTNMTGEVNLGSWYQLSVQGRWWYTWYSYMSVKVWVDWNQDGDFFDNVPREQVYYGYTYGPYPVWSRNIRFQVPTDATPGKTRMRVIANYYTYNYGPCVNGYAYQYNGIYYYNYGYYGECEDYILDITAGVKDTYPSQDEILFANEDYDGTTRMKNGVMTEFKKPQAIFNGVEKAGSQLNYYIQGPLPSNAKVYEGLDPVSGSVDINVGNQGPIYSIQSARGDYAVGTDGTFNASRGGTYRVYAYLLGSPKAKIQTFIVAYDNDLSCIDIVSPKTSSEPKFFKYLRGQTISVRGLFQNTGLNAVTEFYAIAQIYNSDGDMIYRDSVNWEGYITSAQKVEIDFRNVRFNDVGEYTINMCSNLESANDQDSYNDCLPRAGDNDYPFEVSYEIQLEASDIMAPEEGGVLMANRPIRPFAEFKNHGIGDASDVPATFKVYKLPTMELAYESNLTIQDIQSGKYNTQSVFFDQMVLSEPGQYQACATIAATEDPVRSDDTICINFEVQAGLQGTYTVGTRFQGNANNFTTIEDVMDALYYSGVTGPVTFELTDPNYTMTSELSDKPAWDFTSRIIGVGWDENAEVNNTITWTAHRDRARVKGGVTITLNAANGQGIGFGQSIFPTNENAIVHKFGSKDNANSDGYIIFDGGMQKSLRFVVNSRSSYHAAAFYLGRGAQNISVMNCIVENGTPSMACNTTLPNVIWNPTQGFNFQADSTGTGVNMKSYSAGIVMRSTLLQVEESNFLRLDTVPNTNNVIDGNDISGFGYGVVSLGLGPLFRQYEAVYERFYNKDNKITNNMIHDVCRAGIVLGYEEGTQISHNRIWNIGNGTMDATGILAGGQTRDGNEGYNNLDLYISGNEISGISSPTMSAGIKVEQVRKAFQNPSGGEIYFPDMPENLAIVNNIIWGVQASNANASVAGIHLLTERNYSESDPMTRMLTPSRPGYMTRNDRIVNNTIVIANDGLNNLGPIAGIGVQQSMGTVIYNNAIALLDNSIDAGNEVASALFYQGQMPENGGIMTDRNAYYTNNSGADIYRFIETDNMSKTLEFGYRGEYSSLSQWQQWTNTDWNSVTGDFMNDHYYTITTPASLRIKSDPYPLGSILDNRGSRIAYVTEDIDGNTRGVAGQRYDIGAIEFNGRMYVSDVEMLGIPTPGAYKNATGMFSDAQYIMTENPIEVKSRIRNNGSLQQSDINVRVRIYRELPNGTYDVTPDVDETVKATVASTESAEVVFNLSDGIGTDFNPQTYADLRPDYVVPAQFVSMESNVTPKYKIETSVESDQDNGNNFNTKEVRFYLRKSGIRLLVTGENSNADLYYSGTPTADQIAGRLNVDSLLAGLKKLGWFTNIDLGRNDIDLFDRMSWEPRSINYGMYRSMMWSDGTDKPLTRYQRMDVEEFLNEGYLLEKKNLIIGSQGMARVHSQGNADNAEDFLHEVLRINNENPGNPLGSGVSNNGNSVTGVAVGRDLNETIISTSYTNDTPPYCGLLSIWPEGAGLAKTAYKWDNHSANPDVEGMGVATTTLTKNIVHLAVDWRHWSNMERLLRALLDYIENNGGTVVPVELTAFDAQARGKQVDISWSTASELGSSRFEIEKAQTNESGVSEFVKIGEMDAAGTSDSKIEYGPVTDYEVEWGMSYIYRLRIVDLDGKSSLSDEKTVTIGTTGAVELSEAKPNPAKESAKFTLNLGNESNVSIQLFDASGKLMQTIATGTMSGTNEITVPTSSLTSGSYTLVFKSGDVYMTRKVNVVK